MVYQRGGVGSVQVRHFLPDRVAGDRIAGSDEAEADDCGGEGLMRLWHGRCALFNKSSGGAGPTGWFSESGGLGPNGKEIFEWCFTLRAAALP